MHFTRDEVHLQRAVRAAGVGVEAVRDDAAARKDGILQRVCRVLIEAHAAARHRVASCREQFAHHHRLARGRLVPVLLEDETAAAEHHAAHAPPEVVVQTAGRVAAVDEVERRRAVRLQLAPEHDDDVGGGHGR